MTNERIDRMTALLNQRLNPGALSIIDESAKHAGHAGARDGRGHFKLSICSSEFNGLTTLQCHRLVYDVLGDMMQTDIHALSINVIEPDSTLNSST